MQGREDDPGALGARAASCWDRAFRGFDLTAAQKAALVREGLSAVDAALTHAPAHPQALIYKVLLLRLQAALDPDPAARAALEVEADAACRAAADAQKLALIQRV